MPTVPFTPPWTGTQLSRNGVRTLWRDWFDGSIAKRATDTVTLGSVSTVSGNFGPQYVPMWARGVKVFINVTAIGGTSPSLLVAVYGYDPVAKSNYSQILINAGITATGLSTLTVYPGLANVANVVQNDLLPAVFTIGWLLNGTNPTVTFSAGYKLLP
jgi:hypothetical protein